MGVEIRMLVRLMARYFPEITVYKNVNNTNIQFVTNYFSELCTRRTQTDLVTSACANGRNSNLNGHHSKLGKTIPSPSSSSSSSSSSTVTD
jgi:hypothetical protein